MIISCYTNSFYNIIYYLPLYDRRFFIDDIKFVISKYLKLNDAKNFFSLNKNFRKQFLLIYHI